ncbi:MAG TPA: hypothetical protein VIL66_06070 [Bacillota bacterium]
MSPLSPQTEGVVIPGSPKKSWLLAQSLVIRQVYTYRDLEEAATIDD